MPEENKKKYSAKRVIGFLFNLRKLSPVGIAILILTQTIATILTTTVAPFFVSKLLTSIANGSATLHNSVGLLAAYCLLMLFGNVFIFRLSIFMAYKVDTKLQSTVLAQVLNHLTQKSLTYHANKMTGGTVSDMTKLNGCIERFWDTITFNITPTITTIISVCVVLSFTVWQYALVLVILSTIITFVIIKAQSKVAPLSHEVSKKSSAITAYFADIIGNISAVKSFAKEKDEIKAFEKKISSWKKAIKKERNGVLIITGIFSFLMTSMNICAFTAAIFATEYKIANIGSIYLILSYTISVVGQLWSISGITRMFLRVVGDAGPMIETLDEPAEVQDPEKPEKLRISSGKIELKNILFQHENAKDPLFKDFSLVIKPGERIGLIGRSGSGKTSLTRILLRFSDINGGEILIDDQNIAKITQSDLRSSIAYVPQEPILFHRSLRENIAYGKSKATDEEIKQVIKQANAQDFIDELPDGIDTIVGERGVKLSGGQRQRVAIARAILKNAPILVLDEATSALDSENEKLIQDALVELMNGRTSIVIAHRLSTIAQMDRIVVMDNGKIAEQGTHQELLDKKGIYAKLWKHQSGGFIKEQA